jgi:hypothetical protein
VQGKGDDSVVKLRPVVPADLPAKLRRSGSFRVEVDAMPGGYVCSGTMKGALRPTEVQGALTGTVPVRKLFSREQREFFTAHAPDGISFDDLSVLGPIFVLKLRLQPVELGRRLVAEMWLYPDGSETRAFLARRGIDLSGEQQTKTRMALQYFAGAVAA